MHFLSEHVFSDIFGYHEIILVASKHVLFLLHLYHFFQRRARGRARRMSARRASDGGRLSASKAE